MLCHRWADTGLAAWYTADWDWDNCIAPAQYGWTPTHDAAQDNNLDAVALFIDRGADLNIRDQVQAESCMCGLVWV